MLLLLWGSGALAVEAETRVALRVNGPRGNILLQDEMVLPAERVLHSADGNYSVGIYVARMDDGRAVVEVVAGKEKDGKPKATVAHSFEIEPFAPKLQDIEYKKHKWAVEAILGSSWDAPAVTDAPFDGTRYLLAWDDAKLRKTAPELETATTDAAKPKPKPKPKADAEDDVLVVRTLEARDDAASQASPMKVLEPHGTKHIKVERVPASALAKHCVDEAPAGSETPEDPGAEGAEADAYYVHLSDLVPRLTTKEVVGRFPDGTGYRVAAGVRVVSLGEDNPDQYRVETGGLSFVIEATADDLAFYYLPTTHFEPVADPPMSLKPGAVGATQLGEVTWTGDAPLPIQGLRGVAFPIATVRVPCAEVRIRPEPARLAEGW